VLGEEKEAYGWSAWVEVSVGLVVRERFQLRLSRFLYAGGEVRRQDL